MERYGLLGRLLAFGIAGHHAGLADGENLDRPLDPKKTALSPYEGWKQHVGALPVLRDLAFKGWSKLEAHKGYSQAFLARMLFSCLVDADFLETVLRDNQGGRIVACLRRREGEARPEARASRSMA